MPAPAGAKWGGHGKGEVKSELSCNKTFPLRRFQKTLKAMNPIIAIIILFVKCIFGAVILAFLLAGLIHFLANLILPLIAKKVPSFISKALGLLYVTYWYAYGLVGAYYTALYREYSPGHGYAKWFVFFLCFIPLSITISAFSKANAHNEQVFQEEHGSITNYVGMIKHTGYFDVKALGTIVNIANMKSAATAVFAFILFLFWSKPMQILYGGLPKIMAGVFHN